jgi:hypothetical protein
MKCTAKLLLFVAAAWSLSCDDSTAPPQPTPGTLQLYLTTPYSNDVALLLHLTGPALTPPAITAASGTQLYARAATDGVNVAVFGTFDTGPLLSIRVPDLSRASAYRVSIVEVADANNALRASVSGYSGQFIRN